LLTRRDAAEIGLQLLQLLVCATEIEKAPGLNTLQLYRSRATPHFWHALRLSAFGGSESSRNRTEIQLVTETPKIGHLRHPFEF
jgi:pyoverdine/dityrosine biosynthesis protein Dit1